MYKIGDRIFIKTDSGDNLCIDDIKTFRLCVHKRLLQQEDGRRITNEKRIVIRLQDTPFKEPYLMTENNKDFRFFLQIIDDQYARLYANCEGDFGVYYIADDPFSLSEEEAKVNATQDAFWAYERLMFGITTSSKEDPDGEDHS